MAQARTADLEAWLSDVSYNRITLRRTATTRAEVVEPKIDGGRRQGRRTATRPDPTSGWTASRTRSTLIDPMQVPEGVSVLVASDGKTEAPTNVRRVLAAGQRHTVGGTADRRGGVFLLLGLVLYVLAIRHSRRGRGPRRKAPPPLPETEPDVPDHADRAASRRRGL